MGWSDVGDKFKNPWKKQRNRLPAISVSAMDCLTQGFNFVVSMNAFTYGFKEVSNIEIENPYDSIQEGGVNDHKLMVGKPDDSEKTLTFKRGLIMRSPTLISDVAKAAAAVIPNNIARRAALVAINALDPQESLESGPSLGIIQVYSRGGELTGLYNFISIGLKSWKVDDLSATDDGILIEEITIFHTGISRMPVTIVPALFVPSSYSDDRNTWDAVAAAKRWDDARKNKENEKEVRAKILKESKERKEDSEERKLDSEAQKMLDEARKILGDDFEKFAGDLQALLNGEGSIEEKLKRLEEEKSKLKKDVEEYYENLSESIDKREKERRDKYSEGNIESTMEELSKVEKKDITDQVEDDIKKKGLDKVEKKDVDDDKDYVSEKQKEKREKIDEKNKQRKEEAEKRAAEAREKAEKRKEELEKIRAEQAENRNRVEDAKEEQRKEQREARNEEQTRAAEEKAAKQREEEEKRKEENAKHRQEQVENKDKVEDAKEEQRKEQREARNEEQTRAAEEKAAKQREEEKKRKEENSNHKQEQNDNQ